MYKKVLTLIASYQHSKKSSSVYITAKGTWFCLPNYSGLSLKINYILFCHVSLIKMFDDYVNKSALSENMRTNS